MRRMIFLLMLAPALASAYHNDLMSTGDLDGDGDVDLIRILGATVYTMDVNGHDRRLFATMEPAKPGDSSRGADPVGTLADMNSNGSREIVLTGFVGYPSSTGSGAYIAEERYLEIWDPMSQALLHRFERGPSDDFTIVRDLNGDNYRDLVRIRRGRVHETIDPITGLTISGPLQSRWLPEDIVANRYGLGYLVDRSDQLSDLLEFKNPHTSRITQRIWIGGGYVASDAMSLPDLNGNWTSEWSVVRTTRVDGILRTNVLVVDSETKGWIQQIGLIGDAQPYKQMFVNGTDVAVFSIFPTSRAKPLEVRNVRTGALVTRTWFPKSMKWAEGTVTRLDDINGNGSHEVAFIGDAGNQRVVIIKDTRTGNRLRRLTW